MRTEMALYLNGPKYSSAGASAVFAACGGLALFGVLAGLGAAAPNVAATSTSPSVTVRIIAPSFPRSRRAYLAELGGHDGSPYVRPGARRRRHTVVPSC